MAKKLKWVVRLGPIEWAPHTYARAPSDDIKLLGSAQRVSQVELGAPLADEKFEELQRFSQKAKFIGEIGDWLKQRNIPYKALDNTKAAAELPLELLPELARLSDGQIAVLRASGRVAALQLVQSRQAPLDIEQATAYIEQYLLNRKRIDQAKVEVKGLVDAAKVEYFGEFAATGVK